jgi:hypothetical protein
MKNILVIFFVLYLCGCSNSNKLENYIASELKKENISETGIDVLLRELKDKKIILIGEYHNLINEELFAANNLRKLYDSGVRYIFLEGGAATLERSLPGSIGYNFIMFYPWMQTAWRYEELLLQKSIIEINNSVSINEQIKLIFPELQDVMHDQLMNYRGSTAAENIISIMDKTENKEKAVIIYGAAHARTSIIKDYTDVFSNKYDWLPLGYRLKQHYGSDFSSYSFYYPPNIGLLNESKLLLSNNANKKIEPFKYFDGIIVEPRELYGTFYQYNPTNENLEFIFNLVENYALYNQNKMTDNTNLVFDRQGQFLLGLYYLKLYFGDKFDYSFWRTESSKELLTALNELRGDAFNGTPNAFIKINRPYDSIVLYHNYMANSNIEDFLDKFIPSINEENLLKAHELFPEDLWALFWLGFSAAEKGQYSEGLFYFQTLFESELSYCMEILPLAYRKAALCAGKENNMELEHKYAYIAANLYNEYGINVDGSQYTGHLY